MPSQIDMHLAICERNKERNEKYKIHILKDFFDVRRCHFPVTMGIFAWSSQTISTKWLHQAHAANYDGGWSTPGDLARDYLAIKYMGRRIRCTSAQWRECVATRVHPPVFCQPGTVEDGAYLDISGAFWQIVRAVGWDVDYLPGEFLYSKSRMRDFPYPENKMARNCLVSVGLPAPMRLWTGTVLKFVNKPSRFVNLILWRLVQDVLNAIAYEMVNVGHAVYVYTDGYVLPVNFLDSGFAILDEWGINGRVKHAGRADIIGANCYAIHSETTGTRATELYRRRPNRRPQAVNKITVSHVEWLKARFSKLANFAKYEWEWDRSEENDT